MKVKLRWLALALPLMAACVPVGVDFVRPTPESLQFGVSTPEEVKARYGAPRTERSWARGDLELGKEVGTPFGAPRVTGTMSEVYYYHENRGGTAATSGVDPSKSMKFWFWNGRLVGYHSHSSFKADSTGFDEKKVGEIESWKTLRGDLVRLFGPASGVRVYPLVPSQDQQMLSWFTFEYDTSLRQTRARTLDVLVNGIGVVVDMRFNSSAKPLPPPPPATYTPVPIYIPPPKKK